MVDFVLGRGTVQSQFFQNVLTDCLCLYKPCENVKWQLGEVRISLYYARNNFRVDFFQYFLVFCRFFLSLLLVITLAQTLSIALLRHSVNQVEI